MSWTGLGNQTAVVVQLSVWTGRVERSAAIIVTIHSFLSLLLSEWMFLFVVSVAPAVFCFQDLIAGPASPGLMLNTAAVCQWGMKPESGAAGWAAATFCTRLRCYSKNPAHRRVLNVMTMLIHKTSFQMSWKSYTEIRAKERALLITSTSRWTRFMTLFGSRNAGTEFGFFLMRVAGIGWNSSQWAPRWFRFPSMLCDFGWHSASAHSGSLWLYDLSQHGDTAVSSLFWLPLAARWSWHVFRPWCVKVCATLNRPQLCVTSLLPLTVKTVTDLHTDIFTGRSFQKGSNIDQEHWILNKKLMMFCDLYSDIVIHKYVTHIGTDKNMFRFHAESEEMQ